MKTKNKIWILLFVSTFLLSCNEYKGYKKSESGLYYKFFSQNMSGYVPQFDDVLTINMEIRTKEDSVIHPLREITTMMQPSKFKADIFEALSMMHEGDSASFIINAEKYFNSYNYGNKPSFVDSKTMLWFTISITKIETSSQYKTKNLQMMTEQEKQQIEFYLANNQIEQTPTESGLYYIEKKKGKGLHPLVGQTCVVHYTGKLLDGTVFDSSVERGEPFSFRLGVGEVIKGWDEGLALMKKGEKALLIIPSAIGYGDRGAGSMIPPYSPLLFEVELIDILQ